MSITQKKSGLIYKALVVASLLFISITSSLSQSESNEEMLRADFPILSKRMTEQQQSADFVILIDKSKSMRKFWPQVQEGVTAFVKSIPDNDYLSLVTFGDRADYLGTPTVINPATRPAVLQAIQSIKEPPDGNTDLGKAFERCLDELNRPNGNRLKFVFFITDFNHDPPSGSAYARSTDPHDATWQSLAQRRQNELSGKILEVFALLLPLESTVGRNINLGEAVFPSIEKVPVNRDTLGPWFERRRAEIARDKLKAFVQDDLRQTPFAIERIEVQLPLMSKQGRLMALVRPAKGRVLDMTSSVSLRSSVIADLGISDFVIEPVQQQNLTFTSNDAQLIKLADLHCSINSWVRHESSVPLQIILEGESGAEPRDEIHKLNLTNPSTFRIINSSTVIVPCGLLPFWVYLVAGLILLCLILGLLWYIRPEYLVGEVAVVGIAKRKIPKNERKRDIVVGNVPKGDGLTVPGANWRLVIRAFRPFGRDRRSRGIYTRMETGTGALLIKGKRQTLGGSWVRLPRGSTIEVGDNRVSWS